MKTLLISLLLSVVLQNVNSQIKTNGFIETGYLSGAQSMKYDGIATYEYPENTFYADVNLTFKLKHVYLEQQLFNVFNYKGGKTFSVIEIEYKTRIYYKWKALKIGYEHMCLHPIINQHNEIPKLTRRASHDKIFIRLTFNAN
jgi:nitrate reductase gamma subunit